MNTLEKIKKSWWVILSLIPFLNGFGFVYIGLNHNNKNWLLEGVMYEIPWFLYFVYFGIYGTPATLGLNPSNVIIIFALMLMFIGIIRSIWVAIKLADVYDNNEKYTIKSTELNNPNNLSGNPTLSSRMGCCICVMLIFLVFAVIAIL